MEIGQVVDYCLEWNKIHEPDDESGSGNKKQTKPKKRKATQSDWDALMG